MTPYIEIDNTKYEFIANFKMQKEYRKELKAIETKFNKELLDSLGANGINELKELQTKIQNAKTDEEKAALEISINPKLLEVAYTNTAEQEDLLFELNEKYCFAMLEAKYNLTRDQFEKIEYDLSKEKGFDYVVSLINAICKQVFTTAERGTPQQTSWDWEKKNLVS